MSTSDSLAGAPDGVEPAVLSVVETLRASADARTAFGDPVTVGETTVIPVARVAYGFGGGFGVGADPEADGSGAGGGGGATTRPLGVVEVTDQGTRFVRFSEGRRLGAAALLGAAVGYLLGRR